MGLLFVIVPLSLIQGRIMLATPTAVVTDVIRHLRLLHVYHELSQRNFIFMCHQQKNNSPPKAQLRGQPLCYQ